MLKDILVKQYKFVIWHPHKIIIYIYYLLYLKLLVDMVMSTCIHITRESRHVLRTAVNQQNWYKLYDKSGSNYPDSATSTPQHCPISTDVM